MFTCCSRMKDLSGCSSVLIRPSLRSHLKCCNSLYMVNQMRSAEVCWNDASVLSFMSQMKHSKLFTCCVCFLKCFKSVEVLQVFWFAEYLLKHWKVVTLFDAVVALCVNVVLLLSSTHFFCCMQILFCCFVRHACCFVCKCCYVINI